LTLLVSAAFHAQQLGFGNRRLLSPLVFLCSFLSAILIVVVSLSTLAGDISTLHKRGHFYFALTSLPIEEFSFANQIQKRQTTWPAFSNS